MFNNMLIASAPGKIILFGEQAVVYDKLSIAAAIDRRAKVTVKQGKEGVKIFSRNFDLERTLSREGLLELLKKFKGLKEKKNYGEIKKIGEEDVLLPLFLVIGKIMERYGFLDVNVLVESEIPKNLGSSSAVFAATALAISKFLNKNLSKKEISTLTYEGDLIAHGGYPSGIDNSIVTYGGFLQYRKSEGIKPLALKFGLPLLLVNSGEPAKTSQTVSFIRNLKEKKPGLVSPILNKLEEISRLGIISLKLKNLEKLGNLMNDYYQELRKLGISTEKLDRIISLALTNGALGAKPTGGWGGGCCLILAKGKKEMVNLIKVFKKNNFNSFHTKLGVEGVKLI